MQLDVSHFELVADKKCCGNVSQIYVVSNGVLVALKDCVGSWVAVIYALEVNLVD
jgi:hypothetical protein